MCDEIVVSARDGLDPEFDVLGGKVDVSVEKPDPRGMVLTPDEDAALVATELRAVNPDGPNMTRRFESGFTTRDNPKIQNGKPEKLDPNKLLVVKPIRAYPQLSQISEVMFVCTRYQVLFSTFYTQPVFSRR